MFDLVATPENPVPRDARIVDLRTQDGRRLRAAVFPAPGQARGTVALFQGHNEFIEKYFETIEDLRQRGFDVATLDWRGQGGSERELEDSRKGHVDDFGDYQLDLEVFLTQIMAERPQPWFALGHSMGAAILLDMAYAARPPFQRMALVAPMIDLANIRFLRGARWLAETLDMMGLGGMYIPLGRGVSILEQPFDNNRLTTDPARFARNAAIALRNPNLIIGDPTIGWVNAAFRLMGQFVAPEYPRRIRTPILCFTCGREQIVSNNAIERFVGNLNNASLIAVQGAKHELLMERNIFREQFWRAFDEFIPGEMQA